jgi:penicillin-binding protein 2A
MQETSNLKKRKTRHWLNVLLIVLCMGVIAVIALSLSISKLDVSKLIEPLQEPTFVFDRNGAKVSQLTSAKSDPVSLKEVPLFMQSAMVAAEDKRFYVHPGVDVRSIARALVRRHSGGRFCRRGQYDYPAAGQKYVFAY